MKKHHSPRGKRSAFRLLAYALVGVAILSAREVIKDRDGTVSKTLGAFFNDALMKPANSALESGRPHTGGKHATASVPRGMTVRENDQRMFLVAFPKGVTKGTVDDTSLAEKGSEILSDASKEAFVAATKVDLPAK